MEEQNLVPEEPGVPTVISDVLKDLSIRYFSVSNADPDADKKKAELIREITLLADKYAKMYDTDAKFQSAQEDANIKMQIAEMEQENKLKMAKLEAEKAIKLADIEAELKVTLGKADNETKMACCDADNAVKASIAEAELKQRRNEMYISVANAGISAAITGAALYSAKQIILDSFVKEIGQNQIVGRATGSRIANSVGTGVINQILRNAVKLF